MNLSPPPDANGNGTNNARGLVNLVAQVFAGVKTFVAEAVFSAGLVATGVRAIGASLLLRSDLGAGASDKCTVTGTGVADGGVNASAKIWVAATGIGGTQVDKAWVTKTGDLRLAYPGSFRGSSASSGQCQVDDVFGACLIYGASNLFIDNGQYRFYNTSNGTVVRIDGPSGQLSLYGTDSTSAPGAATINKPIGKSSIAVGASSVVVTNSLATAAMHCICTPHARDATCKEIIAVCGAGTITFSGTANATAAIPLSWELKGLL